MVRAIGVLGKDMTLNPHLTHTTVVTVRTYMNLLLIVDI